MSDLSFSRAGNVSALAHTKTEQTAKGNMHKEQRLEKVAAQFETLFISLLMKQKETFGAEEGAFFGNSSAEKNYQEMMNSALAEQSAGGLGIADALLDQLRALGPKK